MDCRVSCQSRGIEDENHKKARKNAGSVTYPRLAVLACLDQVTDLTWGRDDFFHDKMGNY